MMETSMTHDDWLAHWTHEEQQPFAGWDFSYLDGRMLEAAPPWSYADRASALMRHAASVLDLATGGGERLLALRADWPPTVAATEGYPPNLRLATARLAPLGVRVVAADDGDDAPLPFPDAAFDLVLNRHAGLNAAEVARVLAPDVYYLKAVPWLVPGFSVATHAHALLHLQAQLERGEPLTFTTRRYLIEARKPGGR
jgi:hypothetical protein